MTAQKLLVALFASFAVLSLHGCDDPELEEDLVQTTTAAEAASATTPIPPPPTMVSGSLTFKMSESDASNVANAFNENPEVGTAFAVGIASGLEGVESTDITITSISLPAGRRLRAVGGRRLSDVSIEVEYTLKYVGTVPDVTAIDTSAVTAKAETELKAKADLDVTVSKLETPVAPEALPACESAITELLAVRGKAFQNYGDAWFDAVTDGALCQSMQVILNSCTEKEWDDARATGKYDNIPPKATDLKVQWVCTECGAAFIKVVLRPPPPPEASGARQG
jgi:hypothetical protein